VLLSRDETRFQMVPTPAAAPGVKRHRPQVGTRDRKDVLCVFAAMSLTSMRSTPTGRRACRHPTARARRARPGGCSGRSLSTCGTSGGCTPGEVQPGGADDRQRLLAPGEGGRRGGGGQPAPGVHRLPGYGPALNVVERTWKKLRRRASRNRLFDTIAT
jgi:hypothetical protein